MTTDIYEQHAKAFASVSAYVILKDGERVATVAFKFPKDGAGRLYAYVHLLGVPMVRGYANGYGYDKKSAACHVAGDKVEAELFTITKSKPVMDVSTAFVAALRGPEGYHWDRNLTDAGFTVMQAV